MVCIKGKSRGVEPLEPKFRGLEPLEQNTELASIWFGNDYMKLNTDKCHLIVSGYKHEHVCGERGIKKT